MSANHIEPSKERQPLVRSREAWTWEHDALSTVVAFIWLVGMVQFIHYMV